MRAVARDATAAASQVSSIPSVPESGIKDAPAYIAGLHEAVCAHAYGFEATILFSHAVALLVTLHTLYRSRMPSWAFPMVTATSCTLAKYLLVRALWPIPGNEYFRGLLDKKRGLFIGVVLVILLLVSFLQLSFLHSPFVVCYWLLPFVASACVFQTLIPPLPDLHTSADTTATDRAPSSHLSQLCLGTLVFRVAEGAYFSTLLPILLQEDRYIFFDHVCCAMLFCFTCLSTFVLQGCETFVLNRLRLVFETREVGCWTKRQSPPPPASGTSGVQETVREAWQLGKAYVRGACVEYRGIWWEAAGWGTTRAVPGDWLAALSHELFSTELGHPRTSKLLLSFATVQVIAPPPKPKHTHFVA